jgi:AcrR family transcriptional regulator
MMRGVPVERLTPERRRALTRTALVEAATDVFARRGFHAASLDEIADAAGFTRGAIYSNFEGKDDLFLAVLELLTERQLAAFSEALDQSADLSDTETSALAAGVWIRTVREDPNPALLSLEMRLYAMRNPEFRRRLAEVERRQQERIANFIEGQSRLQGRQLRIPPGELAEILNAASVGLAQMAAIDAERGDHYDRLAQTFLAFVAETISVPEAEEASSAKKGRR